MTSSDDQDKVFEPSKKTEKNRIIVAGPKNTYTVTLVHKSMKS